MPLITRAQALSYALRKPDAWRTELRKQRELAWPQRRIRNELVRAIIENRTTAAGGHYVIMSSRQTTKNEVEAEVETIALYANARDGGTYVRTAPTYDQIITSRQRLMDVLGSCPINRAYGGARQMEGNFTRLNWGRARIRFLSSEKSANVVGATASLALSNDELHTVDAFHYENNIEPFAGFNNAPTFNWGVAAAGTDKLQELRNHNAQYHPERNLIFDAYIWSEIWPNTYGRMFEQRVARYGLDNPSIRMNYLLQPVAAVASFFGRYTESFLAGDHTRMRARPERGAMDIAVLIDIAGEEDLDSEEVTETLLETGEAELDSTAVVIVGIERNASNPSQPLCRVLDVHIWIGRKWEAQEESIDAIVQLWQPNAIEVDARGIGNNMAKKLRRKYGARVEAYEATAPSVNEDIVELYGLLYNGRVKMFRNDGSAEYEEAVRQIAAARREVRGTLIKVVKEKAGDRIDFPKALTYLPRAIVRLAGRGAAHGPKLEDGGSHRAQGNAASHRRKRY